MILVNINMFQHPNVKDLDAQIFVGDIDRDVNDTDLFNIAGQAGEIIAIWVSRVSPVTTVLRNAFIRYKTPEQAQEAIRKLNGMLLKSRRIRVMLYDREGRNDQAKLLVKNLPVDTTPKELYDCFRRFGPIFSNELFYDHQDKPRGCGSVQ